MGLPFWNSMSKELKVYKSVKKFRIWFQITLSSFIFGHCPSSCVWPSMLGHMWFTCYKYILFAMILCFRGFGLITPYWPSNQPPPYCFFLYSCILLFWYTVFMKINKLEWWIELNWKKQEKANEFWYWLVTNIIYLDLNLVQ